MYSGSGLSMYVYCMVCYCIIAAPYVRCLAMSFHIVTLLMTIQNAQMDYELSLLPKVFPLVHNSRKSL